MPTSTGSRIFLVFYAVIGLGVFAFLLTETGYRLARRFTAKRAPEGTSAKMQLRVFLLPSHPPSLHSLIVNPMCCWRLTIGASGVYDAHGGPMGGAPKLTPGASIHQGPFTRHPHPRPTTFVVWLLEVLTPSGSCC